MRAAPAGGMGEYSRPCDDVGRRTGKSTCPCHPERIGGRSLVSLRNHPRDKIAPMLRRLMGILAGLSLLLLLALIGLWVWRRANAPAADRLLDSAPLAIDFSRVSP